jgi:hypothetical protein
MAPESQLVTRTADQMTTFNSLVAAAVTLIVGVLIYNNIFDALPDTGGAINGSSVSNTIESAFLLAPVALIVLVASLVLLQIGGLSGSRGNGGNGGNGGM